MKTRVQQRRRGDFRQRFPTHFCHSCHCVLYPEDPQCIECWTARPEDGWTELEQGDDRLLGRVLSDRYLLTKRIGAGASARVYRATSLNIAREFALKLMSIDGDHGGVERDRLDKEVEALSRLRNPHFVTIYEVLELYDNYVALVMDLAEGQRLDDAVEQNGPMTAGRALKVIRQIANGIAEAHSVGFVHRDLKPENIIIERMPAGDDFVRILDLGIVYIAGDPRRTNGFLGSPLYASPEQVGSGRIDARSDLYSLGAIFHFLLCGTAPFLGESAEEVLQAHASKPVSVQKIADVAGPEVAALVTQLLAKDPNERPISAQRVVEQLDAILVSRVKNLEEDSEPTSFRETPMTGTAFARLKTPKFNDVSFERVTNHQEFDVPIDLSSEIISVDGGYRNTHVLAMDGTAASIGPNSARRFGPLEGGTCIAGASSGTLVVVGTDHGEVYLCQDGAATRVFQDPTNSVISAIAVSNNAVVVFGTQNGRVYVGRVLQDVWERAANGSPVTAVGVSSDGLNYAIARDTGLVDIRRVSDGKEITNWALDAPARCVSFSHDGYLVAVVSSASVVTLHQASMGRSIVAIDPGRELMTVRFDQGDQLIGYYRVDKGVRGVRLHGMKAV